MRLKVVSVNVWHGGRLFDNLLAFLKAANPDVLMMQEVANEHDPRLARRFRTVDVLQAELGLAHSHFAPAVRIVWPEGKIVEGNAVLTRFPITGPKVTFLDEPYDDNYHDTAANAPHMPRNLQQVTLATPAGPVNIFNIQGVWDLDGDNYSERRRHMGELMLAETMGQPNVILAGDTNARPTNPAMRAVGAQLQPVFEPGELETTFNMRHKDNPGYATSVVDLMYISPDLRVISKACPDVDISDHRPLMVELEIPV